MIIKIREKLDEVIGLLADMHSEDEDCSFNNGEGCMACICQRIIGECLGQIMSTGEIIPAPHNFNLGKFLFNLSLELLRAAEVEKLAISHASYHCYEAFSRACW